MAVRKCPSCLATVPAGKALTFSNDLECPGCKKRLEVSSLSRSIAMWIGLAAAASVGRLTANSALAEGMLGWALPLMYACLTFSAVSPLVLVLIADLRIATAAAAPEAPHSEGAAQGLAAPSSGGHH